jgi:hypothetical protein
VIQSFHKLAGRSAVTAKRIVQADAAFETALGLVLVVGAATGRLDSGDFPAPVRTPLIVAVGILLLLIGLVLWGAETSTRLLRLLVAANATTAAAAIVWWLAAPGFSMAGALIVLATAAALALLAGLQLRVASASAGSGQLDDERCPRPRDGAYEEAAAHPLDELP